MSPCKTCKIAHAYHELHDGQCITCIARERDRLRACLKDPPPDIQERVIQMLGLVHRDALRPTIEFLKRVQVVSVGITNQFHPEARSEIDRIRTMIERNK